MTIFPVLAMKESVILPGSLLPLRISRVPSISAVESAIQHGHLILAVTQKENTDDLSINNLHATGTLSQVDRVKGNAKDGYQIYLRGISRQRINQIWERDGHFVASAEEWKDGEITDPATYQTMLEVLKDLSQKIIGFLPGDNRHISDLVRDMQDLSHLGYLAAGNLDFDIDAKVRLLKTGDLKDRTLFLLELMEKKKNELQVQVEIRNKMGQKLGKNQREAILREQLRTIRDELGENAEDEDKKDDLRKRIDQSGMPEEVLKAANDEFKRLESMGPSSQESMLSETTLNSSWPCRGINPRTLTSRN